MRILAKRSCRQAVPIFLLSCAVSALGCRDQEEVVPGNAPPQPSLRIGLIPEQNLFAQKTRYRPIADYLAKKIERKVELKVFSRYGNIIDNFVSDQLDGAFFGSFTGAVAYKKLHIDALARPEYADGTSTYRGLLLVRRDSEIRQVEQMKGKRFAFVAKATTAGWLLPLHYFKKWGVDDHHSWLAETYFTGSHEGVIYDVLERNADIGAAKSTVFNRLALQDPRISSELVVLTRSPAVPTNALCVRHGLDESLKRKLRDTLVLMDRDEEGKKILKEFGAVRFIATTMEDYTVVYRFAEEIGLDLETYDYVSD